MLQALTFCAMVYSIASYDPTNLFTSFSSYLPSLSITPSVIYHSSESNIPFSEKSPSLEDSENNLEQKVKQYINSYPEQIDERGIQKKLVIHKQQHILDVYLNDKKIKTYQSISLGDYIGNKEKEGDDKTPEGIFYIVQKKHTSKFYKALLLNYPLIDKAKDGLEKGIISPDEFTAIKYAQDHCQPPPQTTKLGGYIEIHGDRDNRTEENWTWGCAALKNAEMDELFQFAESGCVAGVGRTIVEIHP